VLQAEHHELGALEVRPLLVMCCMAAIGLAAAIAGLQPSAGAQTAPPAKVVDRTFRCTIYAQAGLRQIELSARSAVPDQWEPFVSAQSFGLPNTIYGTLASVSLGGIYHDITRCTRTRARVPLTHRGLSGGRASQFEDKYDCAASRRVLVHVRAVFEEPVPVRVDWADATRRHKQAEAVGRARSAAFAIRTEAGRPIAYGDVLPSGAGRLFTGRGCFPD
jgi:hypothetical protein